MRPEIPDILQSVLAAAERTLKRATGDQRRLDEIEQLLEQLDAAQHWPTDEPRRFVDRRTIDLVRKLRDLERRGPLGDASEIALDKAIATLLHGRVQADTYTAMQVRYRSGRGDPAR